MPPHLDEGDWTGDCVSTASMGSLFNSLVSRSISTLSPLCNDSADYSSETQPKDAGHQEQHPVAARVPGNRNNINADNARPPRAAVPSSKPPRAPGQPGNRSSIRNRKRAGLSVSIPKFPENPHEAPPVSGPGRIASPRNIELRRKNLSERHFFRPVSEDSQDKSWS